MTSWSTTPPSEPGFYFARQVDAEVEILLRLSPGDREGSWLEHGFNAVIGDDELIAEGWEFWPARIEPPGEPTPSAAEVGEAIMGILARGGEQHPLGVLKEVTEKVFPGRELDPDQLASWRAYMDDVIVPAPDPALSMAHACACAVCPRCGLGDKLIAPTAENDSYTHLIDGEAWRQPCRASAIHRLVGRK